MRSRFKKLSFEDKFARHYYANAHRFIGKMKKENKKSARVKLKNETNKLSKEEVFKMICVYCGRDIDEIDQDNMSSTPGFPICEDCYEEECD